MALVPAVGSTGSVWITYTGYTEAGDSLEGEIAVNIRGTAVTQQPSEEPSSWAKPEVDSLKNRNVIPPDLLKQYTTYITRAEFTALLVNTYEYARGIYTPDKTPAFTEIYGSIYRAQIEKGYALGIISGNSDTDFSPGDNLTREQAAKILCTTVAAIKNIQISSNYSLGYADRQNISDWAVVFVAYAKENGLMIGAEANQFKPLDNLTREEAMLLAERLIVKYV